MAEEFPQQEQMNAKPAKNKNLIIVIVIVACVLGVLLLLIGSCMAITIGTAVVSMKEKGNMTACLSNLKMLHAATLQYQQSYNYDLPFIDADTVTTDGGNHEKLLYLIRRSEAGDDPNLFVCPSATSTVLGSSKLRYELDETRSDSDFSARNNSYAYHMGDQIPVRRKGSEVIFSDGWAGGEDIYDTDDDGWNHEDAGNWFTMGGVGKQAEAEHWPNQVEGVSRNWNVFKLW